MLPPKQRLLIALGLAAISAIIFSALSLPLGGFSFSDALAQVYGGPTNTPRPGDTAVPTPTETPTPTPTPNVCGVDEDGRINYCEPTHPIALYCEIRYAVRGSDLEGARLFLVDGRAIDEAALSRAITFMGSDELGLGFTLWYFPHYKHHLLVLGPGYPGWPHMFLPFVYSFNCED